MNPTPETSETSAALLAAAAGRDYVRRAQEIVSGGAKTESFEAATKEYAGLADMLHGDRGPNQVINKEQPIHVLMCYMQAAGRSSQEIADATNYTVVSVWNIQKQPWFRKRFLSIMGEKGGNAVQTFLDGQVMESLTTLVEIRDDNKQIRPHVSAAAANSILDRALGKAVTKIESDNHNYDHGKTVEEVDAALDAVKQELQSRGKSGAN